MIVGYIKADKIQYRQGFIAWDEIKDILQDKYGEISSLPFKIPGSELVIAEVVDSQGNGKFSYSIIDSKIVESCTPLYFIDYEGELVEATQKETEVLKEFMKMDFIENKFVFKLLNSDKKVLQEYINNNNFYDAFMISDSKSLFLSAIVNSTDIKALRKRADAESYLMYNNKKIKCVDSSISMLLNYANSGINDVIWKCENGEWLLLKSTDIKIILDLIMNIKKSLFEKEWIQGGNL